LFRAIFGYYFTIPSNISAGGSLNPSYFRKEVPRLSFCRDVEFIFFYVRLKMVRSLSDLSVFLTYFIFRGVLEFWNILMLFCLLLKLLLKYLIAKQT
jgi:hypothetical protein